MNNPTAVEDVFLAALEKGSPPERSAYLDDACKADSELRRRVERLLQAHPRAGDFLEKPATAVGAIAEAAPIQEGPGTVIGSYKLLEQIGEGGFGVVFMAEQTHPVRRRVALKILKPGMDTRQVVARFEAERQALAIMDHPNIATVLDAGETASGRPFFVMELVRGIPITEYCDEHRLTIEQRLELFVQVCQAVQHAHLKGIIHRDLKPSNVLVAHDDTVAVPKVIDFGVAKSIGPQLTECTLHTAFTQVIGTPLYMSPEQAALNHLDVDTRSDVYSLGVLLYELLTGVTPFDRDRFRNARFDEVRRILEEEDPPRPSSRVSTLGAALTTVSDRRRSDPRRIALSLRGELDWIVLKALEKDRNRRYQTAGNFAEDLERYLTDEPVQACPPSTGYRLWKFVRRNKTAVLAGCLILLTLCAGLVGTTWGLVRAEGQRQVAEVNEHKAREAARAEKAAKETAEARDAETQAVLKFVETQIFAAASPERQGGGLGRDVTLRKAIETAVPFVDKGFANEPLIEARLRLTLGSVFLDLGEAKSASDQFQRARTLFNQHLGPDHPDTLRSMHGLANSYHMRGWHTEALQLREETLYLQKAKLGRDHLDTLGNMHNLALSYEAVGRRDDALNLREETLAVMRAQLGAEHPRAMHCMITLARSYADYGRVNDALKLLESTLEFFKSKFGPDYSVTLFCMDSLANTLADLGRQNEALKYREEALALHRAKHGTDHPDTLSSMNVLANSYFDAGRHAEALRLREETLKLRKVKLGVDHPDTLRSMNNLSQSYVFFGRQADALKLREEALAMQKSKLGVDHPDTLTSMSNLANSLRALGRRHEAVQYQEQTLALRRAKLGPDHRATMASMHDLAVSYDELGRHQDALTMREELLGLRRASLGHDHQDTLEGMHNLAVSYSYVGRHEEALALRQEALRLYRAKSGPDHPWTLRSMHCVAASLFQLNRGAEALPIIDDALQRTTGQAAESQTIKFLLILRLRHFEKSRDAVGCQATAKLWEDRKWMDADSLYTAAQMRAVTAAVTKQDSKLPIADEERLTKVEADQAMDWLRKAVAGGLKNTERLKNDQDLVSLRMREDFQKLLAELR